MVNIERLQQSTNQVQQLRDDLLTEIKGHDEKHMDLLKFLNEEVVEAKSEIDLINSESPNFVTRKMFEENQIAQKQWFEAELKNLRDAVQESIDEKVEIGEVEKMIGEKEKVVEGDYDLKKIVLDLKDAVEVTDL